MKFFTNQSIWKKIVIALLIVLLFNVVVMKPVHADVVEFGGKLMSPILSLFVSLGDGFMEIIGRTIMGAYSTLYEVDRNDSWLDAVKTAVVAIATAAVAIALVVLTAGAAAVALATIGITATVTVGIGTVITGITAGVIAGSWFHESQVPDDLYLPMYTYSAEEIFKGNILLFDVNFFKKAPEIKEHKNSNGGIEYYYFLDDNGNEVKTSNQNSAAMLTKTISSWYNALRNICLVLMLSVLVYIGIRMLLSSIASDKAKYLMMLKDWFIGLCLLFLMHYIMAFSVTLVEKLTNVVKTTVDENAYIVCIPSDDDIKDVVEGELNMPDVIQTDSGDGKEYLYWPTNFMGKLRLELQMEQYGATYIGLCVCFVMLCLFTLYFTVTYLKRVLHMAFLTLIAPMVALTYCIDKLNDGQAQGFNKWFKEYIFNLLIQPMHLLLYYILVTSAFALASTNVIYSIVAIGFMIPAEKLLRSLFGFEKAQTAPAMGPAGAMMASSMLTHLLHKGPRGTEGKNGTLDGDKSDSDKVPMPKEPNPIQAFLGNNSENNLAENQEPDLERLQGAGTESGNLPSEEDDEIDENGTRDYSVPNGLGQAEDGNLALGTDENNLRETPIPIGLEQAENGDLALGVGEQEDENHQDEPDYIRFDNHNKEEEKEEEKKPEKTGIKDRLKNHFKGAPRRIKRMTHASIAAQKAAMKNAPRKFVRNLENSHPIRTVGKIAAGAAVGAAAGAAGLAIAASTGDLSNVAKIGGGAAAAGYALGSGRAQNVKSPMQDSTIQTVYDDAYNKGEYKPDAMNDYVDNFKKDVRNKNYFEQTIGKKDAEEMFRKGGEVEQFLQNGITDKKEMKAMHKLIHDDEVKDVKTVDQAIAVAQLGSMIGSDTNNMTTKKRNEWKTRIGDMAAEKGIKEKVKFADDRLKEIDKYNDFKNR